MDSSPTITVTISGISMVAGQKLASAEIAGDAPPPPVEGSEDTTEFEDVMEAPAPPLAVGVGGSEDALSEDEAPPPPPVSDDGSSDFSMAASAVEGDEGHPPPPVSEAETDSDFSVEDLDESPPPLEADAGIPAVEDGLSPPSAEATESEPAISATQGNRSKARKKK